MHSASGQGQDSHGVLSRGGPKGNADVLPSILSAAHAGGQGGADVVQRSPVDPLVPLAGVVAAAGFELLKEADHPRRSEFPAEGLQAALADFVERLFHGRISFSQPNGLATFTLR